MKKNVFHSLDEKFISRFFTRKPEIFSRGRGSNIVAVNIKKTSPDWAKNNCLVRYKVVFGNGKEIKIRGTADALQSKKATYSLMCYLWKKGFSKGKLKLPRPLAFISGANLLLYEEVEGKPLAEYIWGKSEAEISKTLLGAAEWLAKLHKTSFSNRVLMPALFLKVQGYVSIMNKIRQHIPEFKSFQISRERLVFLEKQWASEQVIIHNDFYPGNFIVGRKNFFGIDFDRAGLGPFYIDLATLLVALEFPSEIWNHGLSSSKVKFYQSLFLRRYCHLRNLKEEEVVQKIKIFKSKVLLDQVVFFTSFLLKGGRLIPPRDLKILLSKIKYFLKRSQEELKQI